MFLLSKNSKLISHSHELFTLLPPFKSGQHPIFVKTYNDCRILGHSSDLSFPSIQFPNSRKSIISNPTSHWTFALRQFLDKLTLNPFTKRKANSSFLEFLTCCCHWPCGFYRRTISKIGNQQQMTTKPNSKFSIQSLYNSERGNLQIISMVPFTPPL